MPVVLDERKLLDTVRDLVRTVTWEDATQAFASSSVVVSPLVPAKMLDHRRSPLAQIYTQSQEYDDEEPGIRYVVFAVRLFVVDRRDDAGEAATMGDGGGDRGLLQLSRRVDLTIQSLARGTVPIVSRGTTSGGVTLEDGDLIVYREHTYRAVTATQPE